jgi:hypothetical protein
LRIGDGSGDSVSDFDVDFLVANNGVLALITEDLRETSG